LLTVKHQLVIPEKARSQSAGVAYIAIVLSNLCEIIDTFVGLSFEQMIIQKQCKETIVKFEKLRADLFNKMRSLA
jgi:hypothetical protein